MPLKLSNKRYRMLLAFSWEGGTLFVTDYSGPVTYDGETYNPVPQMDVKVPASTGSLEEGAFEVTFALDKINTFDDMLAGIKSAPVFLTIHQQTVPNADDPLKTAEATTTHTLGYNLRLSQSTRNPTRRSGIAKFQFVTAKATMGTQMGIPANFQCAWTLFGRGCDLEVVEETATLVSIDATDPKKITMSDFTHPMVAPGGTPGRFWRGGYVERDGIRIKIRDWDPTFNQIFHLVRKPPTVWTGIADGIRLVAGCDKTIETCRERWDNEARFMGCGYRMVDYHPTHEVS